MATGSIAPIPPEDIEAARGRLRDLANMALRLLPQSGHRFPGVECEPPEWQRMRNTPLCVTKEDAADLRRLLTLLQAWVERAELVPNPTYRPEVQTDTTF